MTKSQSLFKSFIKIFLTLHNEVTSQMDFGSSLHAMPESRRTVYRLNNSHLLNSRKYVRHEKKYSLNPVSLAMHYKNTASSL